MRLISASNHRLWNTRDQYWQGSVNTICCHGQSGTRLSRYCVHCAPAFTPQCGQERFLHRKLQPSGDGYLLPDWYGAEPRRHCVSVTHTKKKKWPLFMKHWRNAVRKTPCFTKMKWIFISPRKSVLTDSYAGSKSALSHRARMKSIILPVHCKRYG
ncbi:unnamed protein product (plasmid) [Escherichia coli]|nr:unnamed protein product [Escherichia coli]